MTYKKNLLLPLQEIGELAKEQGIDLPEIRVAVRTGDTPTNERQKCSKTTTYFDYYSGILLHFVNC